MSTFRLASVAPRLARARDEHNRLATERDYRTRMLISKIHETERLVAHRELQLQRSFHTGHGRYIAQRQRKLAAAERALTRLKAMTT